MEAVRDVVDFLKARLDRDEQVARAAAGAPWATSAAGRVGVAPPMPGNPRPWDSLGPVAGTENAAYAEHIARHDPARTLREVAAKRRVVADYEKDAWLLAHGRPGAGETLRALESVIRSLAAVYADHPNYRPDWAP